MLGIVNLNVIDSTVFIVYKIYWFQTIRSISEQVLININGRSAKMEATVNVQIKCSRPCIIL